MRSTFKVLFYTKNQSIKNGRVPVMGRITINGTTASFSCKCDIPLSLWDAKGNCAKGKSEEARRLNRELENIKVRIGKHYQYICDHDTFVTAKKACDTCKAELQTAAGYPGYVCLYVFQRSGPCRSEGVKL